MDSGCCGGVGDVGCRHSRRTRIGRRVRSIRSVALGIRRPDVRSPADGRTGADRSARPRRLHRTTRAHSGPLAGAAWCGCTAGQRCGAAAQSGNHRRLTGVGRRVGGGLRRRRSRCRGTCVAAPDVRAGAVEVDLPHHGSADGGNDGRHVRAVVRPASRRAATGRGRISRSRPVSGLDCRRDPQRVHRRPSRRRAGGALVSGGDGCRVGFGGTRHP